MRRNLQSHLDSSSSCLTLCMVMSAVEEGEIMMIGLSCFFFCGLAPAGASGCAGCRLPMSSFICFNRGPTSARTDSKFCRCRRQFYSGEKRE